MSMFISLKMWHITNENHLLEGWKREKCVHEPGNMAHHRRLTDWRGGREICSTSAASVVATTVAKPSC